MIKQEIKTYLLGELQNLSAPIANTVYVPISNLDAWAAYQLMVEAFPQLLEAETHFVIHRSDFETDNVEGFRSSMGELIGKDIADSGVVINTLEERTANMMPQSTMFQHIKWYHFEPLIPADALIITGHKGKPLTAKLYPDLAVGHKQGGAGVVHTQGRMWSPLRSLVKYIPDDPHGSAQLNIYTSEWEASRLQTSEVQSFLPNPDWLRYKGEEQTRLLVQEHSDNYTTNFDSALAWEQEHGESFFRKPLNWDGQWLTLTEMV